MIFTRILCGKKNSVLIKIISDESHVTEDTEEWWLPLFHQQQHLFETEISSIKNDIKKL